MIDKPTLEKLGNLYHESPEKIARLMESEMAALRAAAEALPDFAAKTECKLPDPPIRIEHPCAPNPEDGRSAEDAAYTVYLDLMGRPLFAVVWNQLNHEEQAVIYKAWIEHLIGVMTVYREKLAAATAATH